MWVRQPVLRRQEMGEFRALMAQERENGSAFHNAYRMSPEAFDELTVQLEPALRRQDTNFRLAITPAEKLALTIRYLASGMSQKDVARYFRLGRATVSKAIPEVCQAIWNIIGPIELPPLTEESWLEDAAEFERRWNFPHCLGAIDGKHIAIQKPGLSGSAFYNYKGGCSVLLMAVADADYRFKYVHVGAFGREHDSTVFNRCGFGQRLARRTACRTTADISRSTTWTTMTAMGTWCLDLGERTVRPWA
ncbi:protein ANTAGONIST OF LIKE HETEROCHROMATIN PROTEIN 1-like [Amphibalanus amphitrite]|nr:protein ANTAGONIST OF LIKE HETEROCHROMATIN PROTEIN 1-like [Amphibalanus amphitrite]